MRVRREQIATKLREHLWLTSKQKRRTSTGHKTVFWLYACKRHISLFHRPIIYFTYLFQKKGLCNIQIRKPFYLCGDEPYPYIHQTVP